MRQTFLGILIAVAGASCLSAQRYSFKFYGEDEGLQDLRVQAVLQDRAGFLWVGTQNGLYRYDGSRFTGFGTTEGLPGASIESLYESRDGTFWVGTQTGLARRKGERFETVPLNVADRGYTGRERYRFGPLRPSLSGYGTRPVDRGRYPQRIQILADTAA